MDISGPAATDLAGEYQGAIDLLLADVIMPATNGQELYTRLATMRPGLKVLFMSGYSDDVIAHHGMIDLGVQLIQKPFTSTEISRRIRSVLSE